MHGALVALPHALVDLPVQITAQRHFVDAGQAGRAELRWRGDFAGVELVERVERGFDCLQRRVQRAKVFRPVLRAQAFAVLAPQQAAVFVREGRHAIGNRADKRRLARVFHVEDRAHVQHPGIDVAEHAVLQCVTVQQGAELSDVVREVFRRHGGVFYKGLRPGLALHVAE